ncbi:MAG: hypothetical protein KKA19_02030 [Candidatus Margulisbacteria bacterium]|nr:hypothetical protein [Candidatus Margulisiibacteriota bacterium]
MLDKSILLNSIKKYSTPQYLYDLPAILTRINELKRQLPSSVALYYAVKANPNLKLLAHLKSSVDGLDISSAGEIKQSILAKYNPQKMNFAGPGKTDKEIEYALKENVGSFSIESQNDLERIESISAKLKTKTKVILRINPSKIINKFAVKMGGKATQFGIDEEDLDSVINNAKQSKFINLIGLHIYAGTQCLDAPSLLEYFTDTLCLAEKLIKKHQLNCQIINFGGGFGVDYFANDKPLNIDEFYQIFPELLKNFENKTKKNQDILLSWDVT